MNITEFIEKYLHFPFNDCLGKIDATPDQFDIEIRSIYHNNQFELIEANNRYYINTEYVSIDTSKKNLVIICIKDNPDLLSFCLKNLYSHDIYSYCNILVIDDRPTSPDNYNVIKNYNNILYCKISNDKNIFNYSVINNIAAAYGKYIGSERLVFWNSDMWTEHHHVLPNLLDKHINNHSTISGTKLVYPSQQDYETFFGKYTHVLGEHIKRAFLTIQHGGIVWNYNTKAECLLPAHQWRFYNQDYDFASIDNRCFAVTGALHIINTDSFIDLGGYGVSFSLSFQDIDLCQRAVRSNKKVYYFGTEHMFHAETITNTGSYNHNINSPMITDNMIYRLIWSKELPKLLGHRI